MVKKRHHHKVHEKKPMKNMGRIMHNMMAEDMDALHHMDAMDRTIHRERQLGMEHYAGYDPRRRQEMRDAGMIHEDHRAVANLPQAPIMKYYTGDGGYIPEVLDDTIRGIDDQMMHDDPMRKGIFKPHKY